MFRRPALLKVGPDPDPLEGDVGFGLLRDRRLGLSHRFQVEYRLQLRQGFPGVPTIGEDLREKGGDITLCDRCPIENPVMRQLSLACPPKPGPVLMGIVQ